MLRMQQYITYPQNVFIWRSVGAGETTITADKWFQPLSEPQRFPRGLKAHLQLPATISPWALTQPETIYADKWWAELSLPVRRPSPVSRFMYSFEAIQTIANPPIVVNVDSWYTALSEPPRRRQVYNATYTTVPFLQPVFPDSWYHPLGRPTLRVRRPEGGLFSITNTSIGPAPTPIVATINLLGSQVTINLKGEVKQ